MAANEKTMKSRGYMVSKHNDLILKSRFSLTLTELKALLFITSKIKPNDEPFTEYVFSINEFWNVCNFNNNTGTYYQYISNALKSLREKVITMAISEDEEIITGWFSEAKINKKTGEIVVIFSKWLTPYLFELQSNFTRYSLEYILAMKSKYGIRLYEFLCCIKYKGYKQIVALDELRDSVGCSGKYVKYKDFRKFVLEPALEDINTYSDLEVSFIPVKTGKEVTHIEFLIKAGDDFKRFINRSSALNYQDKSSDNGGETDDLPY